MQQHRLLASAAALIALSTSSAAAQSSVANGRRSSVSIALVQTRPVGALAGNIGVGYGVTGAFLLPLDRRGLVSVRAEIGAAEYGSESRRSAFSETVGDRIEVNVRTTNAVVPVSIGLQLSLPAGPMRSYVSAGVGGQVFYTESRVEATSGGQAIASTVNQSDAAPAWTAGGGMQIPLRVGKSNVSLDIGASYIGGGRARYLAPGGIVDGSGGHITLHPMESSTHLVVVRLGARVGL